MAGRLRQEVLVCEKGFAVTRAGKRFPKFADSTTSLCACQGESFRRCNLRKLQRFSGAVEWKSNLPGGRTYVGVWIRDADRGFSPNTSPPSALNRGRFFANFAPACPACRVSAGRQSGACPLSRSRRAAGRCFAVTLHCSGRSGYRPFQ